MRKRINGTIKRGLALAVGAAHTVAAIPPMVVTMTLLGILSVPVWAPRIFTRDPAKARRHEWG